MDLIKQFMKMGGFKTPEELEAYGEDNFFRDYPQARQMAMGGTPEAFNMTVPADKFFSYGVPVPPNYYAEGGLVGAPVYPQIQTAGQYFSPVYSDTNNAYAMGGNIEEFPQAQRYPQAGWGKTNHFMLGEGGTFPPGMPQYTGMLPVMQTGAATDGILTRTQDANSHYGVYPMMHGGQPMYAEGGDNNGIDNQQNFYSGRINNFTDTLRNNANTALMKFISPQNEEMAEPAGFGRRGGQGDALRKFQGNQGPSTVGVGVLQPGVYQDQVISDALGMPVNTAGPQSQNAGQMASQQANQQAVNNQVAQEDELLKKAKQMGHNTVADYQASGWQYGPNHPSNTKKQASNKPANKPAAKTTAKPNPGGVSTTVQPVASSTNAAANAPAAQPANANPVATGPAAASNAGTGTGTPAASKEWREVTYNGKKAFVNPDTNELYFPAGSGMESTQQTKSENTEKTENPYQDLYDAGWITPGRYKQGKITKGMDVYLQALAAGQIARGDVKLDKVRNRLIPGTGARYMTFSVPGSGDVIPQPNYYLDQNASNPGAGTTSQRQNRRSLRDFFRGKEDQTFMREPTSDELVQPSSDPNVKKAYDQNFRPGQKDFAPSGGWQDYPGTMEREQVGPVTGVGPVSGVNQNTSSQAPPVTTNVVPPINNNPPSSPYSWDPQFDEARMLGQLSSNEANYFATEQSNIPDKDWRTQQVVGDSGLYAGQRGVNAWNNKVINDPNKKQIWDSYSDMPAPLRDIAGDHLFNAGSDPRIFTLAAAGAIDMKDSLKYKDDPTLLEATWNQNKGLIQQQYNDDPQAFTSSVSDYRNLLYAKSRTKDYKGNPTDIPSNSGTPGLQYNAWSGRTGATQDYIDQTYFGKGTGYAYAAPQFFQKYGGPFALPMYVIGGPGTESMSQLDPDMLKAMQYNPDDYTDGTLMDPAGYVKENNPFTQQQASSMIDEQQLGPDKKFKFKPGKQKKPGWGPEAIMTAERFATNLFERLGKWNHENKDFNTALQTYGTSRKPTNRGSYDTDSGIFRPDQYNWNKRGMYAPDMGYGFAQTGGQQIANMDGDQYYLTQEQINKVIKAGGRVPGF